jgi:hypothetical protein
VNGSVIWHEWNDKLLISCEMQLKLYDTHLWICSERCINLFGWTCIKMRKFYRKIFDKEVNLKRIWVDESYIHTTLLFTLCLASHSSFIKFSEVVEPQTEPFEWRRKCRPMNLLPVSGVLHEQFVALAYHSLTGF